MHVYPGVVVVVDDVVVAVVLAVIVDSSSETSREVKAAIQLSTSIIKLALEGAAVGLVDGSFVGTLKA